MPDFTDFWCFAAWAYEGSKASEFRSEHTHPQRNRCQSNRDAHKDTDTHRNVQCCTWNFLCFTDETDFQCTATQVTYAHMRAHTKTSEGPRAVYQSKISPLFPPRESCLSSTQKALAVFISTFTILTFAWWNSKLRRHRDALSYPTSSPTSLKPAAIHTVRQPCSLISRPWHCAHCDWQASRRWSYTLRHDVVQWSLERTMGSTVRSVCDSVRLLTADRGDG